FLTIDPDQTCHFFPRRHLTKHECEPLPSRGAKRGLGLRDHDENRWVRLLYRPRHQLDLLSLFAMTWDRVVLTVVLDNSGLPPLHDDLEGFLVPLVSFVGIDVVGLKLKQVISLADSKVEPTIANHV